MADLSSNDAPPHPPATNDGDRGKEFVVVLFYKYFLPHEYPLLHQHASFYEPKILAHVQSICHRLGLKGRVLLSREGINGTLSAPSDNVMQQYIDHMTQFELVRECGIPDDNDNEETTGTTTHQLHFLFQHVDWKQSTFSHSQGSDNNSIVLREPFPDLKLSIVKEIISTGHSNIHVNELSDMGGTHLSPSEFHQILSQEPTNDSNSKEVVLIDVRNSFEYDIGHFVNPHTKTAAINPNTVTFSSFDETFCAAQAEQLKDKKVLMYCTGGIRCEKASVMLKKRGVEDVSQLKGGIHRYLEEYGQEGHFRGLNFVFDQRVALTPAECKLSFDSSEPKQRQHDVVGQCIECQDPYDEISGARICTVCRDLVLVCPKCTKVLREYHCRRHQAWKTCYFTFLDVFDRDELALQHEQLSALRASCSSQQKNVRKTLFKQMDKVQSHMDKLEHGMICVDRDAPRYCRSCMETSHVCNGLCWGFWRATQEPAAAAATSVSSTSLRLEPLLPIQVGDRVEPGPHWNTVKHGSRTMGLVLECKSWGAGGTEQDCVVVEWISTSSSSSNHTGPPQPYRWGVMGRDGRRLYDLQKAPTEPEPRH